jgi:hypothetical protein
MDKAIFDTTMKTLFSFARTRGMAFFLVFLSILFTVGCQRYTFPQVPPHKIVSIDEGGFKHKHFIVHAGNNLYDLVDLATNPKALKGIVRPATEPIYYSATRTKPYTKAEKSVADEVHIYLNPRYDTLALGTITLPYMDIYDVRVINKTNKTGVIIAVVLGVGFLTLLAGLGLKSAFEGFHF